MPTARADTGVLMLLEFVKSRLQLLPRLARETAKRTPLHFGSDGAFDQEVTAIIRDLDRLAAAINSPDRAENGVGQRQP